ncbi:MAG: TIGR02206 family membrane protein [Pseudonocardiaceae bacterium]
MEPLLVARQFVPFGLSYWVAVGVLVVVSAVLVVAGRRYRARPVERWLSRALALVFAGFLVPVWLHGMLPGQGMIKYALPLQLCDLASMASVWALWSYSSTAFALTYFWGLTLTSQAFISPALSGPDFPSLQFVAFFGMHSLVLWAAIYLTWGVGSRPDWRGYRIAVAVTLGWMVVVFAFDRATGTNYGFLTTKPGVKSLLDALGPWPWYLLAEVLLGAAAWALITWPWAKRVSVART